MRDEPSLCAQSRRWSSMKSMTSLPRIQSVRVIAERRVALTLTTGEVREVDLAPLLVGPVFAELEDDNRFEKVRVDPEFGCLEWPGGADLCPDVVLQGRRPA